MEVRGLSRSDFLATARQLAVSRPDLAGRLEQDEVLLAPVPGETVGEMTEQAGTLWLSHQRSAKPWSWAAAGLLAAGGVTALYLVQSQPLAGLAVALPAGLATFVCARQMQRHRQKAEGFLDASLRLETWRRVLEPLSDPGPSVRQLADGLKQTGTALLVDAESVRVGGVRLKRKS